MEIENSNNKRDEMMPDESLLEIKPEERDKPSLSVNYIESMVSHMEIAFVPKLKDYMKNDKAVSWRSFVNLYSLVTCFMSAIEVIEDGSFVTKDMNSWTGIFDHYRSTKLGEAHESLSKFDKLQRTKKLHDLIIKAIGMKSRSSDLSVQAYPMERVLSSLLTDMRTCSI